MASARRTDLPDRERLAELSARERQVLGLIARGKSAKGIALLLDISPRTVHLHSASIVRKLGADSRLQAVAMAVRAGLLIGGH
jgi:two-component system response regulator FixJ